MVLIFHIFYNYYYYRRGDNMLIYDHVSSNDARLTWGECFNYFYSANKYLKQQGLSSYQVSLVMLSKNRIIYTICDWFYHFLPALLFDVKGLCFGTQTRYYKSAVF